MERLKNERKSDVNGRVQKNKPLKRVGRLLVEGLIGLAAVGVIASCSASAQVAVRSGGPSASASASSQPAGFGMPVLHESEIRVRREGDTVTAEVHEITDIHCDAINRCTTTSQVLDNPTLTFEVYDANSRSFRAIEGCPRDQQTCDLSSLERGSIVRIRFVPEQDFARPMRGCSTRTER
jgi:hypothetical protein